MYVLLNFLILFKKNFLKIVEGKDVLIEVLMEYFLILVKENVLINGYISCF